MTAPAYIDPPGKLYANLDRVSALQHGEVLAPVNVEVDLSNRCSLGCVWCHFAYTHVRGPLKGKQAKPEGAIPGGDLMDADLAARMVAEFADAGVRSVTWTGGGEPTLHPKFDQIILAAAKAGLAQGIYTHGGHIDGWRAELLKMNLSWVYVSLDAHDKETYRAAKGGPEWNFANALKAVGQIASPIVEGPRKGERGATVGIGYLVTETNWQHATAAIRVAKDAGADYIQFRPTIHYDAAHPGQVTEDTSWLEDAIPHLAALREDFVQVDIQRFRAYQEWDGHPYRTCMWAGVQTVVTPNGKVWVCANKREYPDAELGDLSVESFADIWARRKLPAVDHDCRVMCRGHVPNVALDEMMRPREHPEFV